MFWAILSHRRARKPISSISGICAKNMLQEAKVCPTSYGHLDTALISSVNSGQSRNPFPFLLSSEYRHWRCGLRGTVVPASVTSGCLVLSLSLPLTHPSPFPLFLPFPFSLAPTFFLEVGSLNPARVWGSVVSSPSGVWSRSQARLDLVHFYFKI